MANGGVRSYGQSYRCLSGYLPDRRLPFEKTTLYVACQLMSWNLEDRDAEDPEACSMIEWLEPNALIVEQI